MFNFLKKRHKEIVLTKNECEKYSSILTSIIQLLNKEGRTGQARVIKNLIWLLESANLFEFSKQINNIEMWGGSGAVWDVYIENRNDKELFEREMIKLINLMEETKILGNGIKPIRKFFQKKLDTSKI